MSKGDLPDCTGWKLHATLGVQRLRGAVPRSAMAKAQIGERRCERRERRCDGCIALVLNVLVYDIH